MSRVKFLASRTVARGKPFVIIACSHCRYRSVGPDTKRRREYANVHAREHAHIVVRFIVRADIVSFVVNA